MTCKTISLALVADGEADPVSAIRYAVTLAGRQQAYLQLGIGIPLLIIPVDSPVFQAMAVIEKENAKLREEATRLDNLIRSEAEIAGTMAGIEIFSYFYDPLAPHLARMARASDLCVAMAALPTSDRQHAVQVSLLIDAGVPILIVPTFWSIFAALETATLAWDGFSQSARAMQDVLPLLTEAKSMEIVSILGEKDLAGQIPGAAFARYLARHCKKVSTVELPVQDKNVAHTLFQHAKLMRADLVVMDCYGHSRLREFIFGGVTRKVLAHIEIPTLLSH